MSAEGNNEGRILTQEPASNWVQSEISLVSEWAQGRTWVFRAVLLVFFAYIGIRHLLQDDYWSLFGWFNFGIHELGHVIIPKPRLLHFMAGTLAQCAVPIGSWFMFRKQRDFFSMYCVCPVWLATNLYYVSFYMSSARSRDIPLLSPWPDPMHDFYVIFGQLGVLHLDKVISGIVAVCAFISMWAGIAAGIWIVWQMMHPQAMKVSDL
jgi:hypothetical protein